MKDVSIIGSGIAGIATSIRLASKGYKVKVFEHNNYPGGKINSIELDGYKFNYGPQLLTLPNLMDELYKCAGLDPKRYFKYKRKDIHCVYFWKDGTVFTAYDDKERYLKEFQSTFDVDSKTVEKYFIKSKKKYNITNKVFLKSSLHKLSTYLSLETVRSMMQLWRLDINKSLHSLNQKSFKNQHVVQMFDRYATYNGSSPYKTPGIMSIIQHLEHSFGTYIPDEGMDSIAKHLYNLANDLDVEFFFNEAIEEILTKNNQVIGVRSTKKEIASDIVVSNMDVYHTYNKLLPHLDTPINVIKNERSSSALIFYWGINGTFPNLDLHNIIFSSDYKKEFDKIFREKDISDDPTIYINISKKDVKDHAPKDKENWYVMINVPWNEDQNWDIKKSQLRKNVINKINATLSIDINSLIETEKIITPKNISNDTLSYKGALYGSSSNSKLSAFLRHPNFTNKLKNLYFVGGSVHPGGGIPLCLLSAKIVDDIISSKD